MDASIMTASTVGLPKKKAKKVSGQIDNLLLRPDLQNDVQEFKDFTIQILGGPESESVRVFTITDHMFREVERLFDGTYDQ